ncbi:MAG: LIC12048 family lipoprotein [Leptospirales bacterium]
MKHSILNYKVAGSLLRRYVSFASIVFLALALNHCAGKANMEAVALTAELVDEETDEAFDTCAINPTAEGCNMPLQVNGLFSLQPGQTAKMSSFGTVDPVGTSLKSDFDGDGILNANETIGNYWVADYPLIDTTITAPVTMKIQILKTSGSLSSEITSDYTSDDFETQKNQGSEKFHQKELALRTEKVEYSFSRSSSFNASVGASIGPIEVFKASVGGSSSYSESGERFITRPFVNNIDRNAISVKNSSSENMARKYRNDKKNQTDINTKIESNAGTVRASLFINNHTVNMPVKLSNILCSLLFETPQGELIPVQSFRLRNNDYSMFSVEVYGNSEFGPYVVELEGLNTAEIEKAIARGYTPKIYIIDYQMTHVADSNYRAALSSSFTGDNLKIIEENAKGRTALLKIIGPNMREMFRVAAFDMVNPPSDLCDPATIDTLSEVGPGITLVQALERIGCSGYNITFEHYVLDFTGTPLAPENPVVYTYAVKSINHISNGFPCHGVSPGTDADGNLVNACLVKIANLTEAEMFEVGMWSVFHNGKFFDHLRLKPGVTFDSDGLIPMNEGYNSLVWAGDNYDIVYLSIADILGRSRQFGTNPLETGVAVNVNTRWNDEQLGQYPNYPDTNSTYLGRASLGDRVEIQVQLKDTQRLNPGFEIGDIYGDYTLYKNFSYDHAFETDQKFSISEAFDFEVNLGTGGTKNDWFSITRAQFASSGQSTDSDNVLEDCGHTWIFLDQTYTVCIKIPSTLPGVAANGVVDIYLRPSLNNAYRETVWPESYENVKRFNSKLAFASSMGSTYVELKDAVGTMDIGFGESGNLVTIGESTYTINTTEIHDSVYEITISNPGTPSPIFSKDDLVSVGFNFNGKLKSDTVVGEISFIVVPIMPTDTLSIGEVEAGNDVVINGTTYEIATVNYFTNVHTIHLQSALSENHNTGEPVYIAGTLTEQQVFVGLNSNFLTDWNNDYANSHTVGSFPYDGRMLYTSDIISCSYGLDDLFSLAPGCQGYDPGYLIANWIGAGSFDNNWNDGSKFNTYVQGDMNPLVRAPTTGSEMSVEVKPNNESIVASTTNIVDNVRSGSGNGKSIVVWRADIDGTNSNIRGRIYDDTTGQTIGTEFTVNDFLGVIRNPQVVVSGNTALVVWEATIAGNWDIQGRFIDLSVTPVVNSVFLINTEVAGHQIEPSLDVDGDNAAIIYRSQNGGTYDVYGRFISFSGLKTGPGFDDSFAIDVAAGNEMTHAHVAYRNNKTLFVYAIHYSYNYTRTTCVPFLFGCINVTNTYTSSSWKTRIRTYSTEPFGALSPVTACIGPSGGEQGGAGAAPRYLPEVAMNDLGTKGLLVYYRAGDLYKLDINLETDYTCINHVAVDTSGGTQQSHSIGTDGENAVIVWESSATGDWEIKSATMPFMGTMSPMVNVNSIQTGDQRYPQVIVKGDHALVAWKSFGTLEVRGQVLDLVNQRTVDSDDFPIGTIYSSEALMPYMSYDGANGKIVWQEIDISGNYSIFGQRFDVNTNTVLPLQYGLNNFFISPLVERNYSIRTKLLN